MGIRGNKMKQCLFTVFSVLILLSSCGNDKSNNNSSTADDSGTPSSIDSSGYSTPVTDSGTYNSADLVDNTIFSSTVTVNFSDNTVQGDSGSAIAITADGVSPVSNVTVALTTYGITITSTSTSAVKYILTGSLSGSLTLNSDSDFQLYLDNVSITALAGPSLDIESSVKCFIVTAENSVNTLTDTSARSMTQKASIYSKGILIFSGSGTLNVNGNYRHGIFSNDYIRICSGTLNVNVTARDAVRSVNGFIFDDGNLTINGTGSVTDNESKGIKVEGDESSTGSGRGYIVINGGTITIITVSKGITASFDITEDGDTSSTTYDPSPYVKINNGIITITTTGTPYENADGTSCSPEGIEAKSVLTINSGFITIKTSDDCINAGDSVIINGGYIYAKSSSNDAIDSNGTLTINGGVIVAIGSSAPEGSFDCDSSTFAVTGGTFVGIGGNVSRLYAANCTQQVVIIGSITSGNTMSLVSESGDVAFAFTIPQSYETMIFSSPDISGNTTYNVMFGKSATGDYLFNGIYLNDLSYTSGGSTYTTITTTTTVTQSGGTIF